MGDEQGYNQSGMMQGDIFKYQEGGRMAKEGGSRHQGGGAV